MTTMKRQTRKPQQWWRLHDAHVDNNNEKYPMNTTILWKRQGLNEQNYEDEKNDEKDTTTTTVMAMTWQTQRDDEKNDEKNTMNTMS